MRGWSLLVLLVVVGCGGDDNSTCSYGGHVYKIGDSFPSGDGCNHCSCTAMGVACTALACASDGGIDADPASCAASGGCPNGPACGSLCCKQGERCESGVCKCGMAAACGAGDSCEAAGPLGGSACGSVCCGASGPCPAVQ